MAWFRCYTEIADEPKLKRISVKGKWLWIVLLCYAKESPREGYLLLAAGVPVTLKEIAARSDLKLSEIRSIFDSFLNLKMIEIVSEDDQQVYRILKWDKRQYASDSSTLRVQKHRAKQVNETLPKRSGNVFETDQIQKQIQKQIKDIKDLRDPSPAAQGSLSPEAPAAANEQKEKPVAAKRSSDIFFEQIWRIYPIKRERQKALELWRKEKLDSVFDKIRDAIDRQNVTKKANDAAGTFCPEFPYLHRWLKGRRWEDEIDEEEAKNHETHVATDARPTEGTAKYPMRNIFDGSR